METNELMRKYEVNDVTSVEEFINKYYLPRRLNAEDGIWKESIIASHRERYERNGWDMISHHESITGEIVAFYGG